MDIETLKTSWRHLLLSIRTLLVDIEEHNPHEWAKAARLRQRVDVMLGVLDNPYADPKSPFIEGFLVALALNGERLMKDVKAFVEEVSGKEHPEIAPPRPTIPEPSLN